jgi:hypothetical protein
VRRTSFAKKENASSFSVLMTVVKRAVKRAEFHAGQAEAHSARCADEAEENAAKKKASDARAAKVQAAEEKFAVHKGKSRFVGVSWNKVAKKSGRWGSRTWARRSTSASTTTRPPRRGRLTPT